MDSSNLDSLPPEILLDIHTHLTNQSYGNLISTSTYFNSNRSLIDELHRRYQDRDIIDLASKGDLKGVAYHIGDIDNINEALYAAAEYGHLDIIEFIRSIYEINQISPIIAANRGHLHIVKYIINNKLTTNADIYQALNEAAMADRLNMVRYLIEEVGASNRDYLMELLVDAMHRESVEVVKYLVDKGIRPGYMGDYNFEKDVVGKRLEIMMHLYKRGIQISGPWLSFAAHNDHLELVKALIKAGEKVSKYDAGLITYTASNGYMEIVEHLILHGAKVEDIDLEEIYEEVDNYDIIKQLIDKYPQLIRKLFNPHIWRMTTAEERKFFDYVIKRDREETLKFIELVRNK